MNRISSKVQLNFDALYTYNIYILSKLSDNLGN